MKAVILCAGLGSRLLPHTEYMPKTLVPVCGRPILDYQLKALDGAVEELVLATGYLGEQVREFVGQRGTIVYNDRFQTTNSLYSLWLVRERVRGQEFVLLNGDVVYDRKVLHQLLDAVPPTALLVDDQRPLIEGEMNVVVRDGKVVEIGKELPITRANAQSLQIVKFSPADSAVLFDRVDQLIAAGETGRFPTYAYQAIFARSEMAAVPRRGGTWMEIDTVHDLARCEELVGG